MRKERDNEVPHSPTRILAARRKACQTAVAAVIGLYCVCTATAEEPIQTVAQLVKQIDAQLGEMEKSATSESAPAIASAFSQEIDQLRDRSVMIFGEHKHRWKANVENFREGIDNWTTAVGVDPPRRERAVAAARKAWEGVKACYPEEALQILPPLWSCPMHSELMESGSGTCRVCGMSLEPIYLTQPQLSQLPIIRAEIVTKAPLQVGKKSDIRIRLLFNSDSRPVQFDDLEETHTRHIHLLISDLTETDYHHEHPEAVGKGEYAFSFTPSLPGTYRVWADLKPTLTHIQQFSVADIPSATPGQGRLVPDESENRHAEVDGYRFDLSFDKSLIQEKETVPGTLHVTGPDGKPFTQLGIVMGAFGHFVGFRDDFATVLHIHPVGPPLPAPDAHGGPDLPFYFRSSQAGLVRFFAQVNISGKDLFPRFVIKVQSLQHLPTL